MRAMRSRDSWPPALRDTEDRVFWMDRPDRPEPAAPLIGANEASLVVVGGGLTGLWAALEAKTRDPERDVLLLEAGDIASGASGRNGGFISESLTHGLAHGVETWPNEMPELIRLGRQNIVETAGFLDQHGIEANLKLNGKSVVAVSDRQNAELRNVLALHERFAESAELLDQAAARTDVDSPTYTGALRVRSGGGTVDPAALCWGLLRVAKQHGVRVHEQTRVTSLSRQGNAIEVRSEYGHVRCDRVLLATNAFPPLLRRIRSWVLPILDHVLVTEPLSTEQRGRIGWREEQGLTDLGNRFHYYRVTPDGRILFGGYDATYHFGGRTPEDARSRKMSFRRLADHFAQTFPQLEDVAFTHRWFGLIDATSRFTPLFGTAMDGRVAYAVGYTGLGVGMSRFGAQTALDLVDGVRSERTQLSMVSRRPVPFPPEPIRYPLILATKAALAREDATGNRNVYLRTLDRFGVGFNS